MRDMTTEERIATEAAERLRIHNLKQAHERIKDAQALLIQALRFVGDDEDDEGLRSRIGNAHSAADDAAWWVELAVRDEQS